MESGRKKRQKKKSSTLVSEDFISVKDSLQTSKQYLVFLIQYSFPFFFFLPPYLHNIFYIWGFSITESSGQEVVT